MTTVSLRLREELVRNSAALASLELIREQILAASASSNADDEHDPEGATIAYEREQIAAFIEQTRHTGEDIERALEALDAGTYGRCEKCGEQIAAERLDARPYARTCISCAT
jgi:DnaK suppressor protein